MASQVLGTCSLRCPSGPMSATHPQAVPFSPYMSSPVIFPLHSSHFLFWCMLFHIFSLHQLSLSLSDSLCSLGTSVVQRQYASLHSQVIHCVLGRQVKEYSTFGLCLTECALAFSTLLFSCHLLLPASHYFQGSLLNRDVVKNYTSVEVVCPKNPWSSKRRSK